MGEDGGGGGGVARFSAPTPAGLKVICLQMTRVGMLGTNYSDVPPPPPPRSLPHPSLW